MNTGTIGKGLARIAWVATLAAILAGCGTAPWSALEDDPRGVQCMECKGKRTLTKSCEDCGGRGKVWLTVQTSTGPKFGAWDCPTEVTRTCALCGGTGKMKQDTPPNWASPSDPQPFVSLGYRKIKERDYPGAIEQFNKALQIKPDFVDATLGRAWAKFRMGDRAGAFADYDRVVEQSPGESFGYSARGKARLEHGEVRGALEDFNRCLQINPNAHDFASRGRAKAKVGDHAGAMADITRALQDDPGSSEFLVVRGIIRKDSGDPDGAAADWKLAREKAQTWNRASIEEEILRAEGK